MPGGLEIIRGDQKEVMRAIVELREKHSSYLKVPVVYVLTPVCVDCWSYDQYHYEGEWRFADITPEDWQNELLLFGLTEVEVAGIAEMLQESDANVYCKSWCGRSLLYGRDEFYIQRQAFEDYFSRILPPSENEDRRNPPEWMQRLIFKAYGSKCFGCGRALIWAERSTDHIMPRSAGGIAEPMNLQLLCRRCDNELKRDLVPEEEELTLHFPLIPVSDGYDGPLW